MANALYPIYKSALLAASTNVSLNVDTTTDGPYATLADTGTYSYSAAHDFYNDLSGLVQSAGSDNVSRISTPTVSSVADGRFDGDNCTLASCTAGNSLEAIIIYRHNSGANTTWRLVAFIDTGATGLPVTPNGGDITITWHASGIFQL